MINDAGVDKIIPIDDAIKTAAEKKTLAGTIFSTAISVIRRKGWAQGDWHKTNGAVCLMGAVEDAMAKVLGLTQVKDAAELRDVTNTVSRYLAATYGSELFKLYDDPDDDDDYTEAGSPEEWNDLSERKAEDVIAALETIAAREASTPFDHLLTFKY